MCRGNIGKGVCCGLQSYHLALPTLLRYFASSQFFLTANSWLQFVSRIKLLESIVALELHQHVIASILFYFILMRPYCWNLPKKNIVT